MKHMSIVAMLAIAAPLAAQGDARADLLYPQHQRVRVVAPSISGKPIVARVAAVDSQSVVLVVTRQGSTLSVPLGAVQEMHASGGIDRGKGARRGAIVGLALGAYFFATSYAEVREGDYWGFGTLILGTISFVIPPAIGAGVGYAIAPERWDSRAVPALTAADPGRVALRFTPNEHVRLATTRGNVSGPVQSQTATLVTVVTDDATVPVSWNEVRSVRVRGERSRRRGAVRGAVIAVGITAIGVATDPLPTAIENAGVVISNAGFGALIGAFFPARGWTELPVPRVSP